MFFFWVCVGPGQRRCLEDHSFDVHGFLQPRPSQADTFADQHGVVA